MRNYGVYTRENDMQVWTLESVTNYPMAKLAEEVNSNFGVQTLIVGSNTVFPPFVET
jgi:hypothetical protein